MSYSVRARWASLLLVVIPTALAFGWGLSWALGDYPECSSGNYFLADLGWVFQGIALGLAVGIIVPITFAVLRSFLVAIPVAIAAAAGMLLAGNAGATIAAPLVGCTTWDTRGAGEAIIFGLAISGVPVFVLTGIAVGIGAISGQPQPPSGDETRPPSGPTS